LRAKRIEAARRFGAETPTQVVNLHSSRLVLPQSHRRARPELARSASKLSFAQPQQLSTRGAVDQAFSLTQTPSQVGRMRLSSGQHLREGALSAKRVKCRLAAILASDNATGNFIEMQCVPPRIAMPADALLTPLVSPRPSIKVRVDTRAESSAIAAISHAPVVDSARAKPPIPGSVIEW
jgi:hypothetical protein